jgi:hypothetical protein
MPALGEIAKLDEALEMAAKSIWDIGWLRKRIQETRPGCVFLMPLQELPGEKITGVTGLPENKTVIATAADYHKAYLELCIKLEPTAHENSIDGIIIETFSGLNTVGLFVDGLAPIDERIGISETAIRTNAKLYLEGNGVSVVEPPLELQKIPGSPVLFVCLDLERSSANYLSITTRLQLWQMVSLLRPPRIITSAMTWESPADCFLINRKDSVLSAITVSVLRGLRLFIEFWSKANPMPHDADRERI